MPARALRFLLSAAQGLRLTRRIRPEATIRTRAIRVPEKS